MADTYFSDLDFTFNIHPITGDLVLSKNEQAVIRSVKHLVLTNTYERLFQSDIGSSVKRMLFQNITPITQNVVKNQIEHVLKTYEPRISSLEVDVMAIPEQNALQATLKFYIENAVIPTVVDILLERVR